MPFPKSAVRAYMKRTGNMSQKELAQALGVSAPTMCLVFKGKRHLSVNAARRLSNLSGIPVENLVTGGDAAELLKLLGKRMNSPEGKTSDKSRVA